MARRTVPTACRVSSVDDVVTELTQNGPILGGVYYFGHSGVGMYYDQHHNPLVASTALYVGQETGAGTNIDTLNVSRLAAVQTALVGPGGQQNILGSNASIVLSGCEAGTKVYDYNVGWTSIAQQISNQVKRGVYAWDVGMYFSHQDAAHDPHFNGKDPIIVNGQVVYVTRQVSFGLPMYMLSEGAKGHKPPPLLFTPQ